MDTVYPLHEFDDSPVNRVLIYWTVRVDAVLDAEKLKSSLHQLLSIGSWKKLGGSLRPNQHGSFDIHVPPEWSEERPPFRYSTESFQVSAAEHPIASQLPACNGKPATFSEPGKFQQLCLSPDTETKFKEHAFRGAGIA